jgi:hypothetical protein
MSTTHYNFNYVDPVLGCCPVSISVGDEGAIITKSGYFVPLDSPEADPLLAEWARLKLGLNAHR